ncbi:MAG TPA: glycosyltransferase family 4 protein [Vicinamibacterales bacterium]|nr:glycosyltransferase family 4 protein [Vicinamibacterales bacterium]
MRILYFADIRFPLERANGIQTMETCHALAGRGHEVRLVVKPDTRSPARDPFAFYGLPNDRSLVIERARTPSGAGLLQRAAYLSFAFGRAFGRHRGDIILTRDLGVASGLLRVPRRMRAPLVYESHGYAPEVAAAMPGLVATAAPPTPAKLKRLAAREAHVWHAASGYVTITAGLAGALAARFGPRERVAVVPDGMRMPREATAPPSNRVVAYAGHLYAWKGVDVLLRAIAQVPDARALIVGGHEEESDIGRLRTLASQLGIVDRVTFTGHVEPSKVAAYLALASVVALPNPASAISTQFTSPLKLFEYMAAGRAIVASDLPAIREILRDNENAVLVEPGRVDALAEGIRRVLDNRALADRLARSALGDAPQYTWARRAERIEALLVTVASQP